MSPQVARNNRTKRRREEKKTQNQTEKFNNEETMTILLDMKLIEEYKPISYF